jgi:hypothetical protein
MQRIFVFAIGGTGARVLKSLTMLLAAGVKADVHQPYEIIPILVDPHRSNKDLNRSIRLFELYRGIAKHLPENPGFFSTPVQTLGQLTGESASMGGFYTSLNEVSTSRFRDYIGFDSLDNDKEEKPNKCMLDFLFSGRSVNKRGEAIKLLDIDMAIGFVGNPNIGSVVLNHFRESDEFLTFANNFRPTDRVLIISSIFGGTGAAGFPTILKNIRDAQNNPKIARRGDVAQARVGAITVLPYFNLSTDEKSAINFSQFIAKTKGALSYYDKNVNPLVNAMYYIGDRPDKPYANDAGDNDQQNDAHMVELAAAMAVIDFIELPDARLVTNNGKVERTLCKEFGIHNDHPELNFLSFGPEVQNKLALPLSRFAFFRKYIAEDFARSVGTTAWCNKPPEIGKSFLSSVFFRNDLQEFFRHYDDWIREMADNRRSFKPFLTKNELETFISNILPQTGVFRKKINYDLFNEELGKVAAKKTYGQVEFKLIDLFYNATHNLLTERFDYYKQKR